MSDRAQGTEKMRPPSRSRASNSAKSRPRRCKLFVRLRPHNPPPMIAVSSINRPRISARLKACKNRAKPFAALPQAGPKIVGGASLTHTHALATARQFYGALRAAPCRKCPPIYWDRPSPKCAYCVLTQAKPRFRCARVAPLIGTKFDAHFADINVGGSP